MTIATDKNKQQISFEQFLERLPDEEGRYELVNGEIMRILATRQHDNLADFIIRKLDREVERLSLNYRVSGRIVVRTETENGKIQGRQPDVSVVDKTLWDANPFAYSAFTEPLQLAVEIVSTNWEDDYVDKLDEYQRLGISEFWIIDYLALASRNYLGNPKEPTVFVYLLDANNQYQLSAFRGQDKIESSTFSELVLTAEQLFSAAS
jgi:Uma2 family endonuclease